MPMWMRSGRWKPIDARQDIQFQNPIMQTLGWIASRRAALPGVCVDVQYQPGPRRSGRRRRQPEIRLQPACDYRQQGLARCPAHVRWKGTFRYWLPVDNRLIADEFFRPSYTMGIWAGGPHRGWSGVHSRCSATT